MSEAKHTPIEQWIEEARNKCYPKQKGITNTESNKKMGKKVAFTRGCKELLTYLGLESEPNPKEWVELMKGHKEITGFQTPSELAAYENGRNDEQKVMVKFIGDWQPNETNSVIGQLLADKNNKLQSELEEYKTMESFHKSSSHQIRMLMAENLKLKDELDNKDVEVLNYGMDVVPALKKEIAELKEAKASVLAYISKLESENIKLRNCENCKHEYHPFIEETPCLGCCSTEHSFLNWEGKL